MLEPRDRVGWLEGAIIVAIIVMLVAGFLSMAYVIQQGVTAGQREARAREDRARIIQLLDEFRAAVARGPASQAKAIQQILDEIRRLEEQQTRTIVRNQRTHTTTVIIKPSPYPSPVIVYRPCQINPVNGRCLGGNPK